MVDYFNGYNFKIWWVPTYRSMGGYWNEMGSFFSLNACYVKGYIYGTFIAYIHA